MLPRPGPCAQYAGAGFSETTMRRRTDRHAPLPLWLAWPALLACIGVVTLALWAI